MKLTDSCVRSSGFRRWRLQKVVNSWLELMQRRGVVGIKRTLIWAWMTQMGTGNVGRRIELSNRQRFLCRSDVFAEILLTPATQEVWRLPEIASTKSCVRHLRSARSVPCWWPVTGWWSAQMVGGSGRRRAIVEQESLQRGMRTTGWVAREEGLGRCDPVADAVSAGVAAIVSLTPGAVGRRM